MKIRSFLTVVALGAVVFFQACKNDSPASGDTTTQGAGDATGAGSPTLTAPDGALSAPSAASPTATPATTPEPAQNASGVWHYTCSKGCAGGAGAAGNCATCGGPLAHNQAYHNTAGAAGASGTQPITMPSPTPSATPEPAQNKAGVWHYTCTGGCAGGAGAAGSCAKCGKALAHNSAYHQ